MAESSGEHLSGCSEVCKTFSRSDEVRVNESSPRKPYLSFTIGPHPLRRLVIKIWSHDQGWCSDQYSPDQPYAGSYTWFALGILPKSSDPLRPADEPYLCDIQRNIRASIEMKCHTLDWRLNTPIEGSQFDENEVQGWLRSISSGPCVDVGVFPRAKYMGWVNMVYRIEVELYDDVNTALLPERRPVSSKFASQSISTADAGPESTFLTRQKQGADVVLYQTPCRYPNISIILHNLALGLGERYRFTKSIGDLTSAIEIAQKATEAMPNHPKRANSLMNLGAWLSRRHDVTQSIDDLTRAIEVAEEAYTLITDDDPNFTTFLTNFGNWLHKRYEQTQRVDDLFRTIELREQVVKGTPNGHPNRMRYLNNLAFNLRIRYDKTNMAEDLTRAIEIFQKAVEATADYHPELAGILNNLGDSLRARYKKTGRVNDLTSAIEVFDRVVKTVPIGHPDLPDYLNNLGALLEARYKATASKGDLDRAIDVFDRAVETISSRHPDLPRHLNRLGTALGIRYAVKSSMDDLERAIAVTQKAIRATPDADHIRLAICLEKLGVYLSSRSQQKQSMDDLEAAIQLTERAIALMSEDHPNIAAACHSLGIQLIRKSNLLWSTDSSTRAVEVSQKAVEAAGGGYATPTKYLGTLSQALHRRFEQTGNIDDLTRAIEALQEAVKATPDGHPDLTKYFYMLSGYLYRRHERLGSTDDMTKALEVAEKAAEVTPHHDLHRGEVLSRLGAYLAERYERTRALEDLTRALEVSQQAVDICNPSNLPICLANYGSLLGKKFKRTGLMDGLTSATEVVQKAVEAARNDEDLSECLMSLAYKMGMRYDRTGSIDDLTRGIETIQKAVAIVDHDHIDLAKNLMNYGWMLGLRYAQTHEKTDQDAQLSAYVRACCCTTSQLSDRIYSAESAATINAQRGDWGEAFHLLREAVLLLPKLSPRSLKQYDMQQVLSQTSGMATHAAAIGLNAKKPISEVLSILELGRGVSAGLLIDTRGDLSNLRETYPSLAARFDALRKELNSPSQNIGLKDELSMANRRHQASREFDEVIEEIQAQDGFHGFLRPPPAVDLIAAASSGPIVVINVSSYRCDAILVERDTIRLLGLPGLTLKEVEKYVRDIDNLKHTPWCLLEWLWRTVCRPCLDALGLTDPLGTSEKQWPRVWWIPTGPLSHLPLHAAGIYTPGSKETVLDRVVSSYASSLEALQHGRQRRGGFVDKHEQQKDAILVAMEATEGQMPLPNARTETDKVRALCPSLDLNAITPPRRKADILEHLENCKILHFAGHGQSRLNPSESRLILDDWETDPLTVGDLRESWLQESPAFLAYLSACSTGSNQGKGLADEAIHLVGAFQLAGFRHVVGTLWEVSDPHCVDVATVLYETLCDEGMTDQAVSHGLHRAIRKLRDDSFREGSKRDIVLVGEDEGPAPELSVNTFWIPYIHYGA